MAADSGMDTCSSPEVVDSRKRPLDCDAENGSTKRSHYGTGMLPLKLKQKTIDADDLFYLPTNVTFFSPQSCWGFWVLCFTIFRRTIENLGIWGLTSRLSAQKLARRFSRIIFMKIMQTIYVFAHILVQVTYMHTRARAHAQICTFIHAIARTHISYW